ncbi:MAG: hypothetical protein ABIK39_01510 [candidate division WOR-3 bacterium]
MIINVTLGLVLISQLSSFDISPVSSPQYAGDSFVITVIARDSLGNIYNYNRTAYLSTSRGSGYIYPNVIGPFISGVWQGKVMVTLAERLRIYCTDDLRIVTDSSNLFDVFAGSPSRFLLILPGQELYPGTKEGKSGQPDAQEAGDTFAFQVYLTDAWSNVVRFRTDTVLFKATDSFAQLPQVGVIEDGGAEFSACFRQARENQIFALPAEGETFRPDTASFFVEPSSFDRLLLLLPGESHLPGDTTKIVYQTPGKSGTPIPQFVREPFNVTIYPCDRYWNRVNGGNLVVSLFSDFPIEFSPTETILQDSAVFSAAFDFAGEKQTIWVANEEGNFQSYRSFIDIKARGKSLEVTAPDTVVAGETASIRVVVLDANELPITAALCRFTVVKGNGQMLEDALLTDTQGVAVAHFLCTRAYFSELDTIKISSGDAEEFVEIYVKIPDKEVMLGNIIAFPNPFGFNRDAAEICYYLSKATPIDFRIYDPFGNEVISRQFQPGEEGAKAGVNRVVWNGRNKEGRRVAAGVYVVQIVGELHTAVVEKKTYRIGVVW